MDADRFDSLTERQRSYLRLVFTHHNSSEIGRETGDSPTAIDKQLKLAMRKLGTSTRFEAARQFKDFETGVQPSDPPATGPSAVPTFPLPWPVPTTSRPTNTMTWRQVLAWGGIIAISAPILLTVAAMLLIALVQLVAGFQR